ncbi:MAG TPA: M14 metallopeptidase family protein, partial [Bryobacteraceae bacterium]|nr:M14 metallopeptidase family protein [Bryobacteraceae bacterium]
MVRRAFRISLPLLLIAAALAPAQTARKITTPKEELGFNIGDDYQLANYTQLTAYWKKLAQQAPDRMKLVEIGRTAENRPQWMAVITSPENHKLLDHYKEISRRLAHAEGLTEDQARTLAAEGKAVVWIDGGLHATEVLGAAQLMEIVYQLVSMTDAETTRILRDVIVLCVHANPDGMEMVSNSYMREKDPTKRAIVLERLYQKYVGHDNNRDFYMSNQVESTNMNRVLYREWYPQIMYNHHQTGPAGTVLFAPPFRDPFNYFFDPLIPIGLNLVGAAMHDRFAAEGKPGATMLEGSSYSTWFNGGLRTTTYFHNMIGLLTETIGHPTPMEVAFVPRRLLPNKDTPYPVEPGQKWHFRQSIEYSVTANRAVLDLASRYRDTFLYNMYRMGKNSIDRGNSDHWTMTPKRLEALEAAIAKDNPNARGIDPGLGGDAPGGGRGGPRIDIKYFKATQDPKLRDPRGYIIPSTQADFATATKFVNTLLKNGIDIHRASSDFEVLGKKYLAGSYVIKCAQAFRPHILDMFEPQDHPNDFKYAGGPPTPPYDVTGWTLAYQMGVEFDRVLEAFDGPFTKVTEELLGPPKGRITGPGTPVGYLLSHRVNDSFIAVNRLLKAGDEVYWLKADNGTMFIPARPSTRPVIEKLVADFGLSFQGVAEKPKGDALKLKPVKIALWDRFGGSMPSGWVRWLFEQFEFPFDVVYPKQFDAGNLRAKYDVIVLMDGAMPGERGGRGGGGRGGTDRIPPEFESMSGNLTIEKSVPELKKFLESGGTILTVGSSTSLARYMGVPLPSALVEHTADGRERPLGREKFFVPGSILSMKIDNTNPLAWGMADRADVFFENSPAFRISPEA